MTAIFASEQIKNVFDEAVDLIKANEAETGYIAKDIVPARVAPKEQYVRMEDLGVTRLFTMREAGKLVGYQVFLATPHFRYPGVKFASQDTFFVSSGHRGIGPSRFLAFADAALQEEHLRPLRNFRPHKDLSRLYSHHGYEKLEEIWIKVS